MNCLEFSFSPVARTSAIDGASSGAIGISHGCFSASKSTSAVGATWRGERAGVGPSARAIELGSGGASSCRASSGAAISTSLPHPGLRPESSHRHAPAATPPTDRDARLREGAAVTAGGGALTSHGASADSQASRPPARVSSRSRSLVSARACRERAVEAEMPSRSAHSFNVSASQYRSVSRSRSGCGREARCSSSSRPTWIWSADAAWTGGCTACSRRTRRARARRLLTRRLRSRVRSQGPAGRSGAGGFCRASTHASCTRSSAWASSRTS